VCDLCCNQAVKNKRAHASRRPRQFKAHNDHLGGVLEDYSEKLDKWPHHLWMSPSLDVQFTDD